MMSGWKLYQQVDRHWLANMKNWLKYIIKKSSDWGGMICDNFFFIFENKHFVKNLGSVNFLLKFTFKMSNINMSYIFK